MPATQTLSAYRNQSVSIGYTRDDGDFRILATLNNHDEEFTTSDFRSLVADIAACLQKCIRDDLGEIPTLEAIAREDAPDYVMLEE